LFGSVVEEIDYSNEVSPNARGWTPAELLAAEKAALGFYITGHPLEKYLDLLEAVKAAKSSDLPNMASGGRIVCGGIVNDLQIRTTKKGDKFALLRLEDESGGTKCVLWPEIYRKHATILQGDLPAIIKGRLELSEDNPPTIIVDHVQTIEAVAEGAEFLVLRAPKDNDISGLLDSILSVLSAHPGDCDVALEAEIDDHTVVRIKANNALKVKRSQALDESLRKLGCIVTAEKTGPQILGITKNTPDGER
jgi:DNA polymerase-3 subunit alpha